MAGSHAGQPDSATLLVLVAVEVTVVTPVLVVFEVAGSDQTDHAPSLLG